MRDGSLCTSEGTVTLKARERERVLQVFELRGGDEDRGRNTVVGQSDVLVLGGPACELSELASGFSDWICS